MSNRNLLNDAYDNMRVFYLMGLTAALVSSHNSTASDADSASLIEFIGEAFDMPRELTCSFTDAILGVMMNVGLVSDYQALASDEFLSDEDKMNIELYEIKGRILEDTAAAEAFNYQLADIRTVNQIKAAMKYEYFHHPYSSRFRCFQLERLSACGNVIITRQAALFHALGIGCDKDTDRAFRELMYCVLWGDRDSAVLLSALCRRTGRNDPGYSQLFSDNKPVSTDAVISELEDIAGLIKAFITDVRRDPTINTGLAGLLMSDSFSFNEKAELIMSFNEKSHRNALAMLSSDKNYTGFRVIKNE